MKRILLVLVAAMLTGCSGGISSPLLDLRMGVDSPLLSGGRKSAGEVPVVYPYRDIQSGAADLGPSFGPAWSSLQGVYPDYFFN